LVHRSTRAVLLAVILLIGCASPVLAQDSATLSEPGGSLLAISLAWLVPIGLGLVACGAVPPGRVVAVIRIGWLALGAAVIAYWACGFAFQFGGIGFAVAQPDLAGLAREWSWAPLDASWGSEWGMVGLAGYLLRGPASTPTALALFFSQLPWIVTAVAIPLWSMQGRARPFVLFLSAILFALLYAVLGNWVWGGGWLANLGVNLGLGRGFLDLGGASLVHLAGAASALAGMLAFGTRAFAREPAEQLPLPTLEVVEATGQVAPEGEAYVPMPPLHLPLFATLGAWLVLIGSTGWLIDTPAHVVADAPASWVDTGIALALAAAGGAMTALAFSWLTTGEGNGLMTARGAVGALIAVSAGVILLPQWAALALGAAVGMFVPLVQYVVDHVLRLDDSTSAIAMHGLPSLGGLLALGALDRGTQMQAQLTGSIAVLLVSFVPSWLLFAAVQGLTHGWQEGYVLRLPRVSRPRRRAPARQRRNQRVAPDLPASSVAPAPAQEAPQPREKKAGGVPFRARLGAWFARLQAGSREAGAWLGRLFARARRAGAAWFARTRTWFARTRTWFAQARAWAGERLEARRLAAAVDEDMEPEPSTSPDEQSTPQPESGG
jgi:ammonia channel protein AmtB